MAEYKELSTLYHMDDSPDRESRARVLLEDRRNHPSTFDLGFSISGGPLFLAVPRELSSMNQKVLRRERRVSSLMHSLPGIAGDEVLRSLVIDEVVNSNSIEDVHSTRRQIEEALQAFDGEDLKSKRFREFAKLYLNLVHGDYSVPESPEDIRAIYDKVMDGECLEDVPDGEVFREGPVSIVGGAKEFHKGLLPESAIAQAVEAMIGLVKSPEIPELYSALASHFIFEHAHPFYDGNGRTGRYLLSMYLEAPLSKPTALSLSKAIAENKAQYYKAFETVENPLNYGEVTFFVMAMHELILKAQDQLIARLEKNAETLAMLGEKVASIADSDAYGEKELMILSALLQQRAFGMDGSISLAKLSEHVGVGPQMTRKYLTKLEKRNVVTVTKKRSPLKFAITDHFLAEHGIELQP